MANRAREATRAAPEHPGDAAPHSATDRAPLLDAQHKAAEAEAGDRRDGEDGLAQGEP